MSSILYPVYCMLILMYWYIDVCTTVHITVSLYTNYIQSVYVSICTYPMWLSVNLSHITYLVSNTCILYPVSSILYPDPNVLIYWCLYCFIYHCIAVYQSHPICLSVNLYLSYLSICQSVPNLWITSQSVLNFWKSLNLYLNLYEISTSNIKYHISHI